MNDGRSPTAGGPRDLPGEWRHDGRNLSYRLSLAFVIFIATTSVLIGVSSAVAGNVVALKYCLLFGLTMFLTAALGIAIRSHRRDLTTAVTVVKSHDVPVTQIAYSAVQFCLLVAVMLGMSAFLLTAAIEICVTRGDSSVSGALALIGICGLFCSSFVLAVAFGRVRRGNLSLSAQGIVQRGWSFESRLDWGSIAGITPAFNGHPLILIIGYANVDWQRRYTARIWRIDRLPPVPMIAVDCSKFDVDSLALYRYLRHYVETPGARVELGTPASITRARDANSN